MPISCRPRPSERKTPWRRVADAARPSGIRIIGAGTVSRRGAGGWQLDAIRGQAESLAATVKRAGYQQADSLTAKAGSDPLAQVGAKLAADQLRKETDDKAASIIGEASRRADSLIAAARRQASVR